MQRTDQAEIVAAHIASLPLLAESVFLRPTFTTKPGGEVCDLLLVFRRNAIVLQLKCEQNPDARKGDQAKFRAARKARAGLKQMFGTLVSIEQRDFRCKHPVLGSVSFRAAQLKPVHSVVLIEHRIRGLILPADLPLSANGCSLSYFTLSDFLILVSELRTWTDILTYLTDRHKFPEQELRRTGDEEVLLGHYMLNSWSFPTGRRYEQRREDFLSRQVEFKDLLARKRVTDADCELLETIARSLAKRSPNYLDGLTPEMIASVDWGRHHRTMQQYICELSYERRHILGQRLCDAKKEIDESAESKGIAFRVAFNKAKQDFMYVLAVSKSLSRAEEFLRTRRLLELSLAFYKKTSGMLILIRDRSPRFDVSLVAGFMPSKTDIQMGNQLFGQLIVGYAAHHLQHQLSKRKKSQSQISNLK